ncbi:PBP1A family penicillin-binding protein [bacterium]|nr:PBP1A family penicillin-binding protein [bacterium]
MRGVFGKSFMVKAPVKKFFILKDGFWVKWLKIFGLFLVFIILLGLGIFIYYAKDLPRPEVFEERQLALPTKIYDRTGEVLLYTIYGEEKREPVKLEEIPDHLIKAVLAAEDKNFYKHHGIDFKGIIRSILINLKLKKPVYGGSTISQQLIRSTFLTREKTVSRKIKEIVLTLELERRYSKDQILEWYLNQIPFGPNIYGVEEASKNYFGKSVKEVSLEEAVVLASLIQAPSYYYPFGDHRDELLQRKDEILRKMFEEGFISQEQYQQAKDKEVKFVSSKDNIKAPHFVLYVKDYLVKKYGEEYLKEAGLKVYTTLDWDLYQKTQEIVQKNDDFLRSYGAHNASVVIIDPKTGEILTMLGSKDYFGEPYPEGCTPGKDCLFEPDVNVAIYGIGQQPGSAFKPIVYATAFQKGYTENTIVVDELTNFGKWGNKYYIPQNYDGKFRGPVTLKQALAQSLNIPAVKVLLYLAGIEDSIKTAKMMGITTLNQPSSFYGPALVLGGGEVKLLELTSAYGVFTTGGLRVPPKSVLKIIDNRGNIIEDNTNTSPRRVLSQKVCQMINDILSDNKARAPMFGWTSPLYFPGHWVAAKTGTTDSFRDAWVIGYSKSAVLGIWVGNNDNTPMAKKPAVTIAGPVWHQIMWEVLKKFGD